MVWNRIILPDTSSPTLDNLVGTDPAGYAALHAQTYGETVDAATLIPHMLEAFMAGDRGFRRGSAGHRTSARTVPSSDPQGQGTNA